MRGRSRSRPGRRRPSCPGRPPGRRCWGTGRRSRPSAARPRPRLHHPLGGQQMSWARPPRSARPRRRASRTASRPRRPRGRTCPSSSLRRPSGAAPPSRLQSSQTGPDRFAIASRRCSARLTASASGSASCSPLRTSSDQRGTRHQVDHVVLAQIDQREAERAGVGPADGALDRARPRSAGSPPSARRRSAARASPPTGCRRGRRRGGSQERPHCSSPTSAMIRRTRGSA